METLAQKPSKTPASKKAATISCNEKIQVAYNHPPSCSCGGLEGPFRPYWGTLAPY